MSAEDRPALYRDHARQARNLAEAATSDKERELLLHVADHWEALANIFERTGAGEREDR